MTRKEIPKPRLFKLNHPRLIKIRNNLRKIIMLAVGEEWDRLMDRGEIRKANYLQSCYKRSIIPRDSRFIGGPKDDVSGDRVCVFFIRAFEDTDNLILEKKFFTVDEYKNVKELYDRNYEKYARLYKEHPDRFYNFEEFYFYDDEFFGHIN